MKKALALSRFPAEPATATVLWALLWGELLTSALLLAGGQIPSAAVAALQLFLRF